MNFLDDVVKKIQTKHGKDSLMKMDSAPEDVPRLSSQCIGLDYILGGGFPCGRITEIMGNEGSGKTTLALHALAECQRLGGLPVIIDVEHALDFKYAEAIGLDPKNLVISQPSSGDKAMNIAQDIMREKTAENSSKPLVIVIDSIAALTVEAELDEDDITSGRIAYLAAFLSKVIPKLTRNVSESKAVFLCLNQMRAKIGDYVGGDESSGGKALKFYASVRLQLSASKKRMGKEGLVGQVVKAKTAKNKTFVPLKETELEIVFGEGFDQARSLIYMASELNLFERKGSWFEYGKKRFQGLDKLAIALKEDEELNKSLNDKVIELLW